MYVTVAVFILFAPCLSAAQQADDDPRNVIREREWGDWSDCSARCGGVRTRRWGCVTRVCPPKTEKENCSTSENCPVDGGWTEWAAWGRCRARPCSGERGYKFSSRSCTQPRPQFGGQPCSGRDVRRAFCFNYHFCNIPVDGVWCAWEGWSGCVESFRIRTRTCGCPARALSGDDCPDDEAVEGDECGPDYGSGSGSGSGSGAGPGDQEK